MTNTVSQVNRQLERATIEQQREFLYYLMGWLETAEAQGTVHQNTLLGVEYAAKTTISRHTQPEAAR